MPVKGKTLGLRGAVLGRALALTFFAFCAFVLVLFFAGFGSPSAAQAPPAQRERQAEPEGDAPGVEDKRLRDLAPALEKRAAQREALRRRAEAAAARRGITPEELRAMTPEQRAALMRELRLQWGQAGAPGWRQRMARRRQLAGAELEGAPLGARAVRAQVIATDPSVEALESAQRNGFRILRQRRLDALGLRIVVLGAPVGVSAQEALQRLRALDPGGAYDLNHVYDPSAATSANAARGPIGFWPGRAFDGRGVKIGIVDTGVDVGHPALAGARVTQRAFATVGADRETGHGTAVAALLIGAGDHYEGVIPGAQVLVADVFGSSGSGGAAEAIVEALAWLDSQNVDVINVSLQGPPNRTVEAVVRALIARGRVIVAAVGNEGPTQPVAFPAAYEGVIGVTAIDVDRRVYIAANRGPQVDIAALGVDVVTASDNGAYVALSGTSFAAPIIAAAIASQGRRAANAAAGAAAVMTQARDLGAPGRDPVYGVGAVDLP